MDYLEVTSQVKEWKLQITVVPDGEVSFTVNMSYLDVGCSPREGAAIIREALRMWKLLLYENVPEHLHSGLWCRPSTGDGKYFYRVEIYTRLGFVYDESKSIMRLRKPCFKWSSPTPRKRPDSLQKRGRRGHAHRYL